MRKNFPRWMVGYAGNKANSASLELELEHGLSLAIFTVAKPALSNARIFYFMTLWKISYFFLKVLNTGGPNLGTPSSSHLYDSFNINQSIRLILGESIRIMNMGYLEQV